MTLFQYFYFLSKFAILPIKINSRKSSVTFSYLSLKTLLSAIIVSAPYIGCAVWFFSSDCRKDFWEAFKETYKKLDIAVMLVCPFSIMTPICPVLISWMIAKPLVSVPEFLLSPKFSLAKNWLNTILINVMMAITFFLIFIGGFLSVIGNMKSYPLSKLANLFFPIMIPSIVTLIYTCPLTMAYFSLLQMMCQRLRQVPSSLSEREKWARHTISTFLRFQKGSNFPIFMYMFIR